MGQALQISLCLCCVSFSHDASERKHKRTHKEKEKFGSLCLCLCFHQPRFHSEISALMLVFASLSLVPTGDIRIISIIIIININISFLCSSGDARSKNVKSVF